jgi:Sugar (and other) transporter
MNAIQIVFASVGASFVDKIGRRPMLIWVNIACCLCWIGVIVPASIANITDVSSIAQQDAVTAPVSKAVLAWVYIFQICYSFGWTPMQALYPVEVLSFEMRAKGMAFSSFFTSIGKPTMFPLFLARHTNIYYQQDYWQTSSVSPLRLPILPGRRTSFSAFGALFNP